MKTTSWNQYSELTSAGATVGFEPVCHFDRELKQHSVGGEQSVVHCHHYITLFTQMASDAEHLDGPMHLTDAAAESFYRVLKRYIATRGITLIPDRIAVAEAYFSFCGLGKIRFVCCGESAVATLSRSHIDDGWLRRWGQRDKPVNYMGAGFIKAALAVTFDLSDWQDIRVTESASIVCGAPESEFTASWRMERHGD
ncbi:hypothetical protein KQH82_05755 [bacterium]|nr:hypothetical protein [bacterium]